MWAPSPFASPFDQRRQSVPTTMPSQHAGYAPPPLTAPGSYQYNSLPMYHHDPYAHQQQQQHQMMHQHGNVQYAPNYLTSMALDQRGAAPGRHGFSGNMFEPQPSTGAIESSLPSYIQHIQICRQNNQASSNVLPSYQGRSCKIFHDREGHLKVAMKTMGCHATCAFYEFDVNDAIYQRRGVSRMVLAFAQLPSNDHQCLGAFFTDTHYRMFTPI